MFPGWFASDALGRAFYLLSESQPLHVVCIMPMATTYGQTHRLVKSPQCASRRRRSGEMMTDTADCNLDQKCLMSVSYDGASSQRSGINGLNAHPRKPVRGLVTNTGKANPSFGTNATI